MPNKKVKVLGEFKLQKKSEINSASQEFYEGSCWEEKTTQLDEIQATG